MVEENQIGEFAIIFNRKKTDDELIEEYIPVRVVEGYFYEEEEIFVDVNQNVYSHIAEITEVGNVYGIRTNAIEIMKANEKFTIVGIKKGILDKALKYEYFKNNDIDSKDFGVIMMRNKETGEVGVFRDKDSDKYYEVYLLDKNEEQTEKKTKEPSVKEKQIERERTATYTPNEIITEIKKTIKGQDEAIEKIVTLLWVKYNFPMIGKTNMMVIGPSGVGKTAIFRKIKEVLNIPISIYSVTGTSQAGYKGHDIEEMLTQLYFNSGRDLEKTQNGIVIIDEFDKISNNRDNGEIGTTAIQNELLKLIEGCERSIQLDNFNSVNIDTSNIIFVGCGAFADLLDTKKDTKPAIGFNNYKEEKTANDIDVDTEMIINKGGIIRELAGRLPVIIKLNELSRDNLKDILLNSDESKLRVVIESIASLEITIENLDIIVDGLVDEAINAKIGARGLTKSVMNIFLKIFEDLGNNPGKYERIILGDNILKDNTDYKLVPKKVKKRVKTAEI